jgi:acetylornithine deacetylase/succinyl-diaminopimelate desuccinylase-like protein
VSGAGRYATAGGERPSASVAPETLERAATELVETLRDLIRLRTVNPPGDEVLATRYLQDVLTDAGLRPEVVEPFPGRGSIACRRHRSCGPTTRSAPTWPTAMSGAAGRWT